ncbi:glycoside hydrolase family 10 protein [Salipaludibacillus keqinensis]|nr:family 10 glycosylhydrolase [Salipaludibacillus keqinensis]
MIISKLFKIAIVSILSLALLITPFQAKETVQAALAQDYIQSAEGETHVIANFNVLRGQDQIVVYTPDYGSNTPNNRWGAEVVVENDVILEVRDGPVDATERAPIPENGYVISGHGSAREWILEHLHENESVDILYDVIEDPVRTSMYNVNKVNPELPHEFPGGRGTNELIYYDSNYEYETTGTNQYGAEVIIEDGIVVEMSGSNSSIPENGFVLSGHGTAQQWILQNTQVGAELSFDADQMTVKSTIDAKAYIRAAELKLIEAENNITLAEKNFKDVPIEEAIESVSNAQIYLQKANKAFEEENWMETIDYSEVAEGYANQATFQTVESRVVDARGVWHRPTENNKEEVIRTLDKLADANFNILFLETFFHGYTIYPGDHVEQNPNFEGWDPLEVFIEEGKKRGIEVHSWVHTFFVGHESLNPPGPILSENPEWAAVDREGRIPSVREEGYYYLNPALPDVRDFLSTVFEEMMTKYEDLDGLHLDYIRYPVSLPIEVGYSYDEYSRAQFKKEYGTDPLEITPVDEELWTQWNEWRQKQITTFVERIHQEIKEIDETIDISTAVFPEVSDAVDQKFQNWIEWVSKGYMDFITPMIYSVDTNYVQRTTEEFMDKFEQPVLAYIGLAPFIGFSDELLVSQVDAMNETQALGQVQFALHSLNDEHFKALKEGPQRKEAVLPHRDPVYAAEIVVEDALRRMDEIYSDGIRHSLTNPLTNHIQQIHKSLDKGDLVQAEKRVAKVSIFLENRSHHIEETVKDYLQRDMQQINQLIQFAKFKE